MITRKKKIADNLFSKLVRLSYAVDGYCQCFTCGTWYRWQDIENGHFVKRDCNLTRYDKDNCRPQCVDCNKFHDGRRDAFRERLINEIGVEKVEHLESLRNKPYKLYEFELNGMIKFFKRELKSYE